MAFINLERVDTNFMSHYLGSSSHIGDYIKCPVCGNDFLVGASAVLPKGWPFLIHAPEVSIEDKEYVEGKDFTCPFLMKPLLLDDYKDTRISSFKEILMDDDTGDTWIAPEKFLQESIKQYSRMMKLNGTPCKNCGGKFEFSYGFNDDTNEFYCNFMCSCMSVEGAEDLSRLALEFGKEYRRHDKHMDYIEAVISRMPRGAKMLGTPLLYA